jgi:Sodium/hydrogen exchanger family
VLERLIARFDQIHEYVFLLAIGWCLGITELAYVAGLSHEIGAFIAGMTLAQSPIALFIAESLKPVRDFFPDPVFLFAGRGPGSPARGRCAGLGVPAGDLVKVATVLSFILSSYLIVLRYPTPIAVSDRLRRD